MYVAPVSAVFQGKGSCPHGTGTFAPVQTVYIPDLLTFIEAHIGNL